MTREELREHCERQIQQFERVEKIMPVTPNDWKRYEEHKLILELLEQKSILEELEKIKREIQSIIALADSRGEDSKLAYQCQIVINERISKLKGE